MKVQGTDRSELLRLEIQARLDQVKTQAERNKLGQFATPPSLASDILEYAKRLLPANLDIRFLDPAFGTGSFYSALLKAFPSQRLASAAGYEVDPDYGEEAARVWEGTPLDLEISDFTRSRSPKTACHKANLLICNPPYVRHHHLSKEEKLRLSRLAEQATGVRLSGLAGLYCHFLLLSHSWMAEDGLAGWLIPSEFMDVGYGKQVKDYLLDRVTLLRVHRFDPEQAQFANALVSSAVVWFRNATPQPSRSVEFTYGGTLLHPDISRMVPVDKLRKSAKWAKFPLTLEKSEIEPSGVKLSDLFAIKRGLATGANEFFIVTPEQATKQELPKEFLRPILPSPRYLPIDEVQSDDEGHPLLDRKRLLLACDLPEETVRTSYPNLWRYLQQGVKSGISERYLCRHRRLWYLQENRPPAPILCTYMNRRGSEGKLFRFVLNRSQATAPNVYLMLYPKPLLRAALDANPKLLEEVWSALNGLPPETLLGEGRVYGGGLHKIEPKELGNASANDIVTLLPGAGIGSYQSESPTLF